MTPVPPFTLTQEDQVEYINKFLRPDDDSTTISVRLGDNPTMLTDMLTQISEIMLDEYETEEYETLILERFEQDTIVKTWSSLRDKPEGQLITFYQTLEEDE